MNFRSYIDRPHYELTLAQLEQARSGLEHLLATGWTQDAYEARCAEEAQGEEPQ